MFYTYQCFFCISHLYQSGIHLLHFCLSFIIDGMSLRFSFGTLFFLDFSASVIIHFV